MPKSIEEDWIIIDRLTEVILENTEGEIVEIGSGPSTIVLNRYAGFGVEHHVCDNSAKRCKWLRKNLNCIIYEMDSVEFIERCSDIQIAVGFIDGIHQYDTVLSEVNFFLSKLSPGGVVFLHDTYPEKIQHVTEKGDRCGDVYKIRQFLERKKGVQTFTWPYTARNCGLTMVMKKEKNPPFYRR